MVNYKPYPKYKPSGVEWIGDIPEGWEVKKLKYFCDVNMGQSPDSTEYNLEGVGLPFLQGNADFGNIHPVPRIWCDSCRKIADKDDILFSVRAPVGAVNVADQKYGIGRGLCSIEPLINKRLFYYIAILLKEPLNALATGSTYDAVAVDDVKSIQIVFGPDNEQYQIANFLDQKTGQIDDLIQKKEKMIKLLKEKRAALINQAITKGLDPNAKMKPSGIDWIGDIPEGWEVFKLKYLTQKIGSGITPKGGAAIYENEGIPLLRSQNIHFDTLRLDDVAYISEEIHQNMIATEVHEGDVLFNITGASIGRCNYWPKDIGIANVNQHVCIVRPSALVLTKYLYFSLSSDFVQQQVWLSQDGSSREGLNFADFGCFTIIVPKIEEQQKVLKFLESKISEINMLIQKIESVFSKLHEYRSSIITAAVTGKVDVRGNG